MFLLRLFGSRLFWFMLCLCAAVSMGLSAYVAQEMGLQRAADIDTVRQGLDAAKQQIALQAQMTRMQASLDSLKEVHQRDVDQMNWHTDSLFLVINHRLHQRIDAIEDSLHILHIQDDLREMQHLNDVARLHSLELNLPWYVTQPKKGKGNGRSQ